MLRPLPHGVRWRRAALGVGLPGPIWGGLAGSGARVPRGKLRSLHLGAHSLSCHLRTRSAQRGDPQDGGGGSHLSSSTCGATSC